MQTIDKAVSENTGKTSIEIRCDWFTGKVEIGEASRLRGMLGGNWLPTLPRWGYRYAYQMQETGAITMADQPHTEASDLLLLSGQAIVQLSHHTGSGHTFALIAELPSIVYGATRVDLAIDLHDNGTLAYQVAQSAREGKIESRAKKITVFESWGNDGGITTYVGARTSPKMLRVYYKKNLDGTGETVTRLEMELKKDVANWVWATYLAQPPYPTLQDLLQVVKTLVERLGVDHWDNMTDGVGGLCLPPRPDSQLTAKDWLARQVVPMLKADYKSVGIEASVLAWLINEVTGIEIAKLPSD